MQIPGSDAARAAHQGHRSAASPSCNDCNGRHCYLDPYRGAKAAVAEAARNLAAAARLPVAVTDCLNFGNPEKGEIVLDQFEQAVEGMAEACEAFDTPVVCGNVSFYNESFGQRHLPHADGRHAGRVRRRDASISDGRFKDEGDVIVLLGAADTPGSTAREYQKVLHGKVGGPHPRRRPRSRGSCCSGWCATAWRRGSCAPPTTAAEGGLAVALAECCVASGVEGGALTGGSAAVASAPTPGRCAETAPAPPTDLPVRRGARRAWSSASTPPTLDALCALGRPPAAARCWAR